MDKVKAPDQEQLEIEQRDCFRNGQIRDVSRHARIPYGTLTKQLNPQDVTESILYQMAMFLYGCWMTDPRLEQQVWSLPCRHRPRLEETKEISARREFEIASDELVAISAAREEGLASDQELEAAKWRVSEAMLRLGPRERSRAIA